MSERELLELHGIILGDGTYYLDRGKYPHMILFNFNLNLIKRTKKICERFTKRRIKISSRMRKTGIEYSINIPVIVTRKLLEQNFNKKKLSQSVVNSKYSIFLLKGLYESDGSNNGSQVYIYQKNAVQLLRDCQKIANLNGLSAHIHNSNRKGEQYLAIENVEKIKKLFGNSVKKINSFEPKIRGYHIVKRMILNFLNDNNWRSTSDIYNYLEKVGIKISKHSNSLLNKHLNRLWELGLLEREDCVTKRNNKGQFIKSEYKWKLKNSLTQEQILNFPYGVLR